jgi:hypothetical protein
MASIARLQVGVERMVWNSVRNALISLQLADMAIYTRNTLLVVYGVWEVCAVIFMAGNAQIRGIFEDRGLPIRIYSLFERGAVGIMADGAIHTASVVCTDLPFLPTKACVAMALSTCVSRIINGHGAVRVICWGLAMAGFTAYTVSFPCDRFRIIACNMACKTSAWTALICPGLYEHGVISGMSVWAAHPGSLEFGMAGHAVKRFVLWWRTAFLCLCCDQGYTGCQQSE